MERTYICIDLKSFYASVECVERKLDPFKVNLVVADPERSKSTICLAITPAMKKLGVKNRCRVHEIPKDIEYITAMPRMQLYIDYSAWIYTIYLKFVAPEDIHVYSIDECFMDVTDYLNLYNMTGKELAVAMMDEVFKRTGITATAGVGTNLYLAKIAMDIVAKKVEDHIGILDEQSYRKLLWTHTPITDFWMIGKGKAKTLASYGLYTMGDIARASINNEDWLFRIFGVDAELLIDHAWGYEPCRMSDIKNYKSVSTSLSSGQVLMRNYSFQEARVIIREMVDQLALKLVEGELLATAVSMFVSYDHRTGRGSDGMSMKLPDPTNSSTELMKCVSQMYDRVVDHYTGIRRLGVNCNNLIKEGYMQLGLFTDVDALEKEKNLQRAMIEIRSRFGKNAVFRGSNLLECSTLRERNSQIGGHKA